MRVKRRSSYHSSLITYHLLILSSAAAAGAASATAAGASVSAGAAVTASARAVAVLAVAPGPAAVAALGAGLVDGVGLCAASHRRRRVENLAAVYPALDADDAEGRVRLREAVVNVGAQSVQRQTPLEVPLRARDLRAVQAAGDPDLDPLP